MAPTRQRQVDAPPLLDVGSPLVEPPLEDALVEPPLEDALVELLPEGGWPLVEPPLEDEDVPSPEQAARAKASAQEAA